VSVFNVYSPTFSLRSLHIPTPAWGSAWGQRGVSVGVSVGSAWSLIAVTHFFKHIILAFHFLRQFNVFHHLHLIVTRAGHTAELRPVYLCVCVCVCIVVAFHFCFSTAAKNK